MPAIRKTVTVGVQAGAVRKPRQPGVRPRVAPSVAKVSAPQAGCVSAPVGVPVALTALLGNAAPIAAYPQSIIPPFAVPLEGVPAVADGPVDTGAPVLQQPAPTVAGGAASAPSTLLPWMAFQHYPSPSWSSAGGRPPVGPATAQVPTETDRELEQPEAPTMPGVPESSEMPGQPGTPELPGLPALPETPIGGPGLEPSLPPLTPAQVPEPASLALVMLAGLLAAATQAARGRRSARGQA